MHPVQVVYRQLLTCTPTFLHVDIAVWLWHRHHSPAWARVLRLKLRNGCALGMASVRKTRVDTQNDLLNIFEALDRIFITATHI